jgi:hypothetical protein
MKMAKITTNEFDCEYKITKIDKDGDSGNVIIKSKIVGAPGTYKFSFVVAHSVTSEFLVDDALREMMRSTLVVTGNSTPLTYKNVIFTRI